MDESGGGDPSSHCRALTHPCAQTVVGTCSVPDRNLHVLRLTKLRLLLGLTQHAAPTLSLPFALRCGNFVRRSRHARTSCFSLAARNAAVDEVGGTPSHVHTRCGG